MPDPLIHEALYRGEEAMALLVVALCTEVALRFLLTGERENYSITLRDLTINREE
jgi:hypothetical protein